MRGGQCSDASKGGVSSYGYQNVRYDAMQPFWNGIVDLLPMWMAPNLITLIGTMFMIINITQYWFYDLTLKAYFPPYFFYVSSVCVFVYQTLDAIDGKQARRTGTSSPLG